MGKNLLNKISFSSLRCVVRISIQTHHRYSKLHNDVQKCCYWCIIPSFFKMPYKEILIFGHICNFMRVLYIGHQKLKCLKGEKAIILLSIFFSRGFFPNEKKMCGIWTTVYTLLLKSSFILYVMENIGINWLLLVYKRDNGIWKYI